MVQPSPEAVEEFTSITGVPESVAVRKLEEHGGDLNGAVNAHFNEGEGNRNGTTVGDEDMMNIDDVSPASLLSAASNLDPFSLIGPAYLRGLLDRNSDFDLRPPVVSHPREIREIPIETSARTTTGSGLPTVEDVTGIDHGHVPESRTTIIIEDEDGEIAEGSEWRRPPDNPEFDVISDDGNDIEEEMIRAAIEASKREARVQIVEVEDHVDSVTSTDGRSSGERRSPAADHLRQNGNGFPLDEWGGMSSEERHEAVMLEEAMFGSGTGGYVFPSVNHRSSIVRPPSPSLQSQRLIREQQDDEYLASLQADRDRELKETESAVSEEKRKLEESSRKLHEAAEMKRLLVAKEASLPRQPPVEDENAVTLLVRMPDGSRRGRRFLKSDKLQSLFDFIDVGGGIKPGSYKLVRPFPRQTFGDAESSSTLHQLGLTGKQEAFFLEAAAAV